VPQTELDRFASTVVKLGFQTGSSASEVLDMASKIGSIGKAAGMSVQQVLGLSGGLASVGIEAGRGGMAVAGMIGDMAKSVATTDDKLAAFAATAGMTGDQFKVAFKENATGAVLTFFEGLNQVQKRGGDVFSLLSKMGLESNLVAKEVLKAAGSTDKLAKSLGMSAEEWKENAELTELAELRDKMFSEQLAQLWNRVKDFLLTIGQELIPTLKVLNKWMLELTTSTSAFGESAEGVGKGFGESFISALGSVGDAVQYLQMAFYGLKIAVTGIGSGIAFLFSNIFRGAVFMMEGAVNGIVSGVNLAIRALNRMAAAMPAWMGTDTGKSIPEIDFKLNIDLTTLKELPGALLDEAKDAKAKLDEAMGKEKFSDKLLAEYAKVTEGVKKENKEIHKDIAETFKVGTVDNKGGVDALNRAREDAKKAIDKMEPATGLNRSGKADKAFLDPMLEGAHAHSAEKKDYESRLAELEKFNNVMGEMDEETKKKSLKLQEEYSEKLKQLKGQETKMVMDSGQLIFDSMEQMALDMGGKQSTAYKAMFAASKAFAIATSIVKISQGIATAAGGIWPENLIAMASVMAATSSIVSSIKAVELNIAGERALGGPVVPGSTFLVGERGPELFSPSTAGNIIPNDRLGGGKPVKVIVNNYTDAQSRVTERNEGQERVIDIVIRRVKTEIGGDIRDGTGSVSQAMEKSFGLKRGRA